MIVKNNLTISIPPRANNKVNNNFNKQTSPVSFTGGSTLNIPKHPLEPTLEKIFGSKPMQKLAKWGAEEARKAGKLNIDKLTKSFASITAIVLSSFYLINTARNKKIEKERKPALMTNMALVTTFSTVGGFTISKVLDKQVNKAKKFVVNANKELRDALLKTAPEEAKKIHLSKLESGSKQHQVF